MTGPTMPGVDHPEPDTLAVNPSQPQVDERPSHQRKRDEQRHLAKGKTNSIGTKMSCVGTDRSAIDLVLELGSQGIQSNETGRHQETRRAFGMENERQR